MLLDYPAICTRLAQVVSEHCPGLNCANYIPDMPEGPMFAVGPIKLDLERSTITHNELHDYSTLECHVYTERSGDPGASLMLLARYMSGAGEYSIREAIKLQRKNAGSRSLGGLCADIRIMDIGQWREYAFGVERRFYGFIMTVLVVG